ncbi:MAG: T9SS type A sorting domain-containing protein, partial [Bacteroidota bacterium]
STMYLVSGNWPICMNSNYELPAIGIPTNYLSGTNEAFERYKQGVRAQCNCTSISLSTQDQNEKIIQFFPNPANDIIYFDKKICGKSIEIQDASARLISIKTIDDDGKITINDIAAGIYILKSKELILNSKLIKY